ncbi:hypothetical protein Tco_0171240 [Tanacetum coccineum]
MLVLNRMIGALFLKLGIGRHSGKEKVTLDDLFLLHSIDGGVSVDIPWHVAKFFSDKAKGSRRKSLIVGAHLIRKIASYYGLMCNTPTMGRNGIRIRGVLLQDQ